MSGFRDRVEAVVAGLGHGEIVTYGEVAAQAGSPGAARGVGSVLRTARTPLPWWRVVAAGGRITSPSASEQERRLRAEGIDVRDGVVRDPPLGGGEVLKFSPDRPMQMTSKAQSPDPRGEGGGP